MRVGLNLINIDPTYSGGVNSYAFGLLHGFQQHISEDAQFIIFASRENQELIRKHSGDIPVEIVPGYNPLWKRGIRNIIMRLGASKAYKAICDLLYGDLARFISERSDIVYIPTTVLFPFNLAVPTVLSMHDIQHVHFPEFFSSYVRNWRRILYGLSATHCPYFQASSTFIKEDLVTHFPTIDPGRVRFIPEGVEIETMQNCLPASLLERFKLPKTFFFMPAQQWLHKDHLCVLKAFREVNQVCDEPAVLVLSGADGSATQQIDAYIDQHQMQDYVRRLGRVSYEELVALYQRSHATIVASLYESSSLCILEAAAAGTPSIASATPPNIEMAEKIDMLLFKPSDWKALADQIRCSLNSPEKMSAMSQKNCEAIQDYSWSKIARNYLEWFREILGGA